MLKINEKKIQSIQNSKQKHWKKRPREFPRAEVLPPAGDHE